MRKSIALPIIFLSTLSLATPAHAYLDPGTGSIILQLLLGGSAGVLMVGKLYWAKIKGFLGIGSKADDLTESENTNSQ